MQDRSGVADAVTRACNAGAGTVQALAEEVGVSYAALCSWSRARRHPPAHRLNKLADVLDSRADQLRDIAAELRSRAIADDAPAAPSRDRRSPSDDGLSIAPRDDRADATRRSWAQLPDSARSQRDRAASARLLDVSP